MCFLLPASRISSISRFSAWCIYHDRIILHNASKLGTKSLTPGKYFQLHTSEQANKLDTSKLTLFGLLACLGKLILKQPACLSLLISKSGKYYLQISLLSK